MLGWRRSWRYKDQIRPDPGSPARTSPVAPGATCAAAGGLRAVRRCPLRAERTQ